MADSLPEEITVDILSRLLTEQISHCALVCKTWRNLIYNDRSFARMHSRLIYDHDAVTAVSSGKASFIQLYESVTKLYHLKHLEYDADNHQKPLKFEIIDLIPPYYAAEVVGSSNGLICISMLADKNIEDPIYICNPVTKEYVYLPKLSVNDLRSKDVVRSGFGYHPSTGEYKVVRIYCRAARPSKNEPFVGRVQVYTLGSGTGWRNREDINYNLYPPSSSEILANGALHWFDEQGNIVAFNLADEKFYDLRRKPKITSELWNDNFSQKDCADPCFDFQLRVMGGCLCIIDRFCDARYPYPIWSFKQRNILVRKRKRMSDDNEKNAKQEETYKSSWCWKVGVASAGRAVDRYYKHNKEIIKPFAILQNGNIVVYHDDGCNYVHSTKKDRDHRYQHIAHEYVSSEPTRYVKSFVSLKAIGEKEAKIIEPSEGVQKLPRSDLDTRTVWPDSVTEDETTSDSDSD